MPGRAVLAIVAAGLVLTGCGSGPAPPTTTSPDPLPAVGLTIDETGDDSVAATRRDGALVADVRVSGRAQPGSYVRVTSGCAVGGCTRSGRVDDAGTWAVDVRAQAPPGKPYARIYAQLAAETAITLVQLDAPKPRAERVSARRPTRKHRVAATAPALPQLPDASPTPTPMPASASSVLLVGDSLGVGIQPFLAGLLPGWSVSSDVRTGRPLAEGMARWREERGGATVSAFSLFTNDAPTDMAALEAAVRESAAAGCTVWATIVRPPDGGVSYDRANALLERLAAELPGRVQLVPWAQEVAARPALVGGDGIHATTDGYRLRAQLYAQAIQACV